MARLGLLPVSQVFSTFHANRVGNPSRGTLRTRRKHPWGAGLRPERMGWKVATGNVGNGGNVEFLRSITLQGINISPFLKAYLKMIFLFCRWDMLISWRVYQIKTDFGGCHAKSICWNPCGIKSKVFVEEIFTEV